jgi:hypothetical protein
MGLERTHVQPTERRHAKKTEIRSRFSNLRDLVSLGRGIQLHEHSNHEAADGGQQADKGKGPGNDKNDTVYPFHEIPFSACLGPIVGQKQDTIDIIMDGIVNRSILSVRPFL